MSEARSWQRVPSADAWPLGPLDFPVDSQIMAGHWETVVECAYSGAPS
jgi:hypothetical protein